MSTMGGEDFDPKFEGVPKKLDVIVDLPDGQNILTEIAEEPELSLAICLDMSSGEMYIGDDHTALLQSHSIPEDQCRLAAATFDGLENVTVTILGGFFGMGKNRRESDLLEKMMAAAIRRDILRKQE